MRKNYIGSSLDDLFEEDETFEEAQALAIKDVVVWQLTDAMEMQSLSKARLAVMEVQSLAGRSSARPGMAGERASR